MTTHADAASLRFGRFELQSQERRLLLDGAAVALGARAFDLLLALTEQPGRLLSKGELMDRVWPGLVVQENNLAAQVSSLRKVLGDDVIATIPGRGYRFAARLQRAAAPAPLPPPPTAGPRTNLPSALRPLIGRACEQQDVAALLEAHRLVSVVGAGGAGKSLLAQHLLQARSQHHAQGVCWVELDGLAPQPPAARGGSATAAAARVPADLAGAVAAALGIDSGAGTPWEALQAALAPMQLLLALDNAEHRLADVAGLCRAVLDAAPGVRLLVTSQAPLRVATEQTYRLGPLACPAQPLPAAQALQYGAVALFQARARATDSRFVLNDADAAAAIALCSALEGLPLAIELAAARAPSLGLPRLLASMRERLALLTRHSDRHAPARQQTLRATLEWSHGLLDERSQCVFRRLAVMAGGAPLEFIEQVLAGSGGADAVADASDAAEVAAALDRWELLDALDALVERSLVAVRPGSDGGVRYRLLDSPRALAQEQLQAAGERPWLQRRHALALAARFDAAYGEYFSAQTGCDAWLRRYEGDLDQARAALAWACQAGDAVAVVQIGATLLRALPPSLHAERMALAETLAPWAEPPLPAALQCRIWIELSCAWADTQRGPSLQAARRALALARGLGTDEDFAAISADERRFMQYHALCRAASAAAQAGDLQAAGPALAELRGLQDPAWPAQRLLWAAEVEQVVARLQGDRIGALKSSRRLLALDLERGADGSIALANLIDAELAAGDAAAAAASGEALVARLSGTRHEYSLAFARLNLCAAWLALGDLERARAAATVAWPQAVAFELHHYAAAYLAWLAALERRAHAAAVLLGYAEAAYAARREARETNEALAMQRSAELARAALGESAFDMARAQGGRARIAELQALAFGTAADEAPGDAR